MNKEELEEKHEQSERKEFIKKIIISIAASLLGTIISILLFNRNGPTLYPIHRAIFLFLAYWFVVLHFCISLTDMYSFITKHRFKIAGVILVFMTLMQYTTSSNSVFSHFTLEKDKNNAIIGSGNGYLYTDYAVEEPLAVSQSRNNYARFNNMIGGIDTDLDVLVHSPVKNIFIIAKLYNVGYLLLGPHMGLAFETTFKALFLILASYEFLMMVTKNKKAYAIVGSFTLFASVAARIDVGLILACVETILVLLDKFMLEEKMKKKVLYVLGMSIALLTFVFTFYLPYIIPFGYFMIAAAIWIILKNRKEYKLKIVDILLVLSGIIIVGIFVLAFYYTSEGTIKYLFNTVYPGQGDIYRINGIPLLFSYLYNYLLPFKTYEINGLVFGTIFSLFPLPILIAFYYAFYKDKDQEFFLPMIVFATFIIVATVSKFPDFINQITLFKYVYQVEASIVADFVGFLIMFYYLANVQENIFKVKGRIRFLVVILLLVAIVRYPAYIQEHRIHLSVMAIILCWCGYSFLASSKKEYRGALLFCLAMISITGLFLKPISIGMHGITDLNISQKIEEISREDKEGKWIALGDLPIGMANFIAANGGTVINGVPFYQGEEFYNKVLGEEKAKETKDIWNRYAHVLINLGNESQIEKEDNEDDIITLKLDKTAVDKLNVKYIMTYMEESEIEKEGYKVTKLFETLNDGDTTIDNVAPKGIYIYELN